MLLALATLAAENFTYDAAGRLTLADYGDSGFIRYEYDLLGHLTQMTVSTTTADTDADGDQLPDAWEWVYFGGLHETAPGDPNLNGRTNLEEFLAGSDPATQDNDGDGISNVDELTAGTDPFSADSCPRLTRLPGTGITLSWTSAPNRTYRILRATEPTGVFVAVTDYLPAQTSGNIWTDQEPQAGTRFYRLEITGPHAP